MSFFASKCVRCGHSTRREYHGKPTCETCRNELDIALAEANEAQRMCPSDASALKKALAHGVIIDRCPTCGGVWLDAGELERVSEEVLQEVALASGFVRPLG
jgi:hypothetical protein